MNIKRLFDDDVLEPEAAALWISNMKEPWFDYEKATKFVQLDNEGRIIAGFAVYFDDSDGVQGNFISGWSVRKNFHSVVSVIQDLADMLGEIYIKTDKRHVKIFSKKMGKLVKNAGSFSYYIIKGKKNGKAEES